MASGKGWFIKTLGRWISFHSPQHEHNVSFSRSVWCKEVGRKSQITFHVAALRLKYANIRVNQL